MTNIINQLSLRLPFFSLPGPALMLLGTVFTPPLGDLLPTASQTTFPPQNDSSPHLTLEMVERVNILEALRVVNRDMKELFSQLRVPIIDILNLVEPLELKLAEPVQKIRIILIPLRLSGLGLRLSAINPMSEEPLSVLLTSLSRKRKASALTSTPTQRERKRKRKV